jgi:hypothetical protein
MNIYTILCAKRNKLLGVYGALPKNRRNLQTPIEPPVRGAPLKGLAEKVRPNRVVGTAPNNTRITLYNG